MQRTIATIFFEEIKIDRSIYGGLFTLPAVAKGEPPALVVIQDHHQRIPMPHILGGGQIPKLVEGEVIAEDVREHACEKGFGMSVDSGPGVWVVREEMPVLDESGNVLTQQVVTENNKVITKPVMRPASEAERKQMFEEDLANARTRQAKYGEYLIGEGDRLAQKPEQRRWITARMKTACKYYGRERDWLEDLKDSDVKRCLYCTRPVPAGAVKCPHCHEVIDLKQYAALEAQKQQALKEAGARASR